MMPSWHENDADEAEDLAADASGVASAVQPHLGKQPESGSSAGDHPPPPDGASVNDLVTVDLDAESVAASLATGGMTPREPSGAAATHATSIEQVGDDEVGLPRPTGMVEAAMDTEEDAEPKSRWTSKWKSALGHGQRKPSAVPIAVEEPLPVPLPEDAEDENGGDRFSNNRIVRSPLEIETESAVEIPEAFLVEDSGDEEVVVAIPALPWWKQRKTKLLLTLVFTMVAIFAIAFGVERAKNGPGDAPPTAMPSAAPSVSASPSAAPSSCAHTIASNRQKIHFQVDNPRNPIVALDGRHMAVMVQEATTSEIYTIFYALTGEGWVVKNVFQEEYKGSMAAQDLVEYTVALSGDTALVGLPGVWDSGTVLVYKRNDFGFWEKVEELRVGRPQVDDDFGLRLDVDGDWACVADDLTGLYLFRRVGDRWVQFDVIEGVFDCSIAGDTIAVRRSHDGDDYHLQLYTYNDTAGDAMPIQDPIPTNYVHSMALSENHLVYWDCKTPGDCHDILIYQRDENHTFAFLQELNVSTPTDTQDNPLALDEDILVVGNGNHTVIYSEQNGYWEEALVLDESYDSYQLSGRSLLVTTLELDSENMVHAYNIERCTQDMPTAMPSLSFAPTICYPVKITVVLEWRPARVLWELRKIDPSGDVVELKSYSEEIDAPYHTEEACLQEGEYEFMLYDSLGMSHYNITSDGMLIHEGRGFDQAQTVVFAIPFTLVVAPSGVPSSSPAPSTSLSPSSAPTTTAAPSVPLPDLSPFGYPFVQNSARGFLVLPPYIEEAWAFTRPEVNSLEECASSCNNENATFGGFYDDSSCRCFFYSTEALCKEPCMEYPGIEFGLYAFDEIEYCRLSFCHWYQDYNLAFCETFDAKSCDVKLAANVEE